MLKFSKNLIINKIKKSRFYWKYRHLINKNVWDIYFNDSNSKRRNFIFSIIKKKKIKSVFEFGCASGPNFFKSQENIEYYFGYDISKKAINVAKSRVSVSEKIKFTNSLSKVKKFLEFNDLIEFDLAIYDRVLYLLDDSLITIHFNELSRFFKYIVIDDFHSTVEIKDESNYLKSKNFKNLVPNDFELIYENKSKFKTWNNFTKKTSKVLIFSKKSKTQ